MQAGCVTNEHVHTFSSWCNVSAHSLNAVKAESFDGAQLQHLCIITNSVDPISDPIQGHNFTLGEPEIDKFFSFSDAVIHL